MTGSITLRAHDRGSLSLWAGVVVAALLCGTHLVVGYMLVPWVCTTHHQWVRHALAVMFAVADFACFHFCWRISKHGEADTTMDRTRFAALVGMMSSGLFTLLIIAQYLPTFFLRPCWD